MERVREESRFNQVDQKGDLAIGEMTHNLTASKVDGRSPPSKHVLLVWIEHEARRCQIDQDTTRTSEGPEVWTMQTIGRKTRRDDMIAGWAVIFNSMLTERAYGEPEGAHGSEQEICSLQMDGDSMLRAEDKGYLVESLHLSVQAQPYNSPGLRKMGFSVN